MFAFLKELSWLMRHKGAVLILIGAPVLYAFFYPLPYQQAVVEQVPLVVFNDANSIQAQHWIDQISSHPKLKLVAMQKGLPESQWWQAYPQAEAFIYFPAGLDDQLAHQQQQEIPYGGKADNFLVYATAMKAIAETLNEINIELAETAHQQSSGNSLLAQQAAQPIKLSIDTLFNTEASYLQYLVPVVFSLMVQQVIIITLGMHWGYRFEMQRPLGHFFAVWLAHIAIYLIAGLALIAFFYQIVLPLQGVQLSCSGLELLSVAVPYVLAVIGFGMVISIGFKEQETAIIWLLPVSVPILLLAGASWPSFMMAPWAQALADFIPSTWGITALVDRAFMANHPDYSFGWLMAALWLLLALLLRWFVHGTAVAAHPANA